MQQWEFFLEVEKMTSCTSNFGESPDILTANAMQKSSQTFTQISLLRFTLLIFDDFTNSGVIELIKLTCKFSWIGVSSGEKNSIENFLAEGGFL